MNSRERVIATAERRRTDRPASGLRCTPEAWASLRAHLGVKTDREVMDVLDVDLRWVYVPFIGPRERSTPPLGGEGVDFWGCRFRKAENEFNTYYEIVEYPLGGARSAADVDAHDWPSLDWWDYGAIPDRIAEVDTKEPRGILFFAGGAFETPWYMRGFERFMLDLYENTELQDRICTRVVDTFLGRARRVLAAAGGRIDVVGSGGDIGGQSGMLLQPDLWRERIKPHTGRLIGAFKDMGLKTFYHSCGSLVPVIDDLIGLGLDILEPIQVTAAGMKPEELGPRFADRLSFHGAIDEVNLLPHATASQVFDETTRILDVLGRRNGLIVAPSHQVQGDTPPENVVAIFDAVKAYGRR